MPRKSERTWPEWVEKFKEPNTEVHVINGIYYLYHYTFKYNKETKSHNKKSVYVGRITEEQGLIRKGGGIKVARKPRTKKYPEIPTLSLSDNVEYGIAYWMEIKVKPLYYHIVSKHFGIIWQTVIAVSFCRLVYQSPICDMQRHFKNSFLSQMLPDARMGDKDVTNALTFIGRHRELQVSFFNEFIGNDQIVIFDGTLSENSSQKMYLPQYTKLKDGSYGYGINTMNGFSVTKRMPIYVRNCPGNIKDVSIIKLCINEIGKDKDITALFDKGFYSEDNIEFLLDKKIHFIMPLRRSVQLDYDVFTNNSKHPNLFMFEDRAITAYELEPMYGCHVYIYLDDELQCKEKHDAKTRLMNRIKELEEKQQKDALERRNNIQKINAKIEKQREKAANTQGEKKFSKKPAQVDLDILDYESLEPTGGTAEELWTNYYKSEKKFGTIALISDKPLTAETAYVSYKARDQVEKMNDVSKSIVESDIAHMQNQDVYNGWMFCNHLALHWYFLLYNMLVDSKEIKHFTPHNILTELGYHQIVKMNGTWTTIERTKKQKDILDRLGLDVKYPYV